MEPSEIIIVPHEDCGNEDYCGCIMPRTIVEQTKLVCNGCCVVVDTVPAAQAQQTLMKCRYGGVTARSARAALR